MKHSRIGAKMGAVLEYEAALLRLHDLMAQDKDESPEGERLRDDLERLHWRLSSSETDSVREAMELPERQLIRAELSLLNGLSADLYMLQDDEIFETRSEGETDPVLESALRTAWERQQWEVALSILRKNFPSLTTEGLATLRAHAYDQLGLRESARRFQQKAAELTLRRWLSEGASAALTPLE